ncbi:MAG: hypothetical protein ACTHU0_07855 [Kofleriaceae bacterium]
MSVRSDVLLWAQRTIARQGARAHQLLEIEIGAGIDQAQEAFHRIARMAHPDLHRGSLTAEELEQVTTAFARCASAYQELKSQHSQTTRMRPMRPSQPPVAPAPAGSPPAGVAPAGSPPAGIALGTPAMAPKALLYYRKAELSLRRGDLRGAVLQLKMAIATDPQSVFLRTALIEVEAEVGKKP